MKKISAVDAYKIAKMKGVDLDGDGFTFYAYDENTNEIFSFDSKKERDDFIRRHEYEQKL